MCGAGGAAGREENSSGWRAGGAAGPQGWGWRGALRPEGSAAAPGLRPAAVLSPTPVPISPRGSPCPPRPPPRTYRRPRSERGEGRGHVGGVVSEGAWPHGGGGVAKSSAHLLLPLLPSARAGSG